MGILVAGNWKMNGTRAKARALAQAVGAGARELATPLAVAPPHAHLEVARAALEGSPVALSGQDCVAEKDGAYTGDVSSEMLRDSGCSHVILGHSERRQHRGETDALIAKKLLAALRAGLTPILCVGERLDERDRGEHEAVVRRQLEQSLGSLDDTGLTRDGRPSFVVAYEPVWAIGTGRTATPEQAREMHACVRDAVAKRAGAAFAAGLTVLYGGSVKADNSAAFAATPGVDGALVGGASLDPAGFLAIARAFEARARSAGATVTDRKVP